MKKARPLSDSSNNEESGSASKRTRMAATSPLVCLLAPSDGQLEAGQLSGVASLRTGLTFDETTNAWQISDEDCKETVAILLSHLGRVDRALLDRCPKLRVVARHGTGVDNVDLDEATELGVCVCNVPDYGIEEVADTAMAHVLALFRQTAFLDRGMREGQPLGDYATLLQATKASRRIRGKTLGIIGLGNIGMALTQRAKSFGFLVKMYDPYLHPGIEKGIGGVERVDTVEELIQGSDCVSIHCPLTKDNHHIINKETLKLFKKEAFLVNVARGGLVEEAALAEALKTGQLAGAALDVQEHEPFQLAGSVLEGVPNLLLSPHSGWCSQESVVEARLGSVKPVTYCIQHPDNPKGVMNCVNRRSLDWDKVMQRWAQ